MQKPLHEVLARLVRTPGKPGDLDSTLQHIAHSACEAFSTDACIIFAFNPITGKFRDSRTAGDLRCSNEYYYDIPRAEGIAQRIFSQEMLLVENLDRQPEYHNRFTRTEGFRSFAGLALCTRHRKRPLGIIYLNFREPHTFKSEECEEFHLFALQASLLLQETWLAHHYDQIARIGQEANQNLATPEDLFQILQKYVDSVLDEKHTLLLAIHNPQINALNIYMTGDGRSVHINRPLEVGGACRYVLEAREAIFISQLSEEQTQLPFKIINITGTKEKESLIFVPLVLRTMPLGVLSIQHPLPNAYGQEDLFVLQLLANYLSLAIHNMRLYNSLSQLHETGQILTQQLESEQTLQVTVDKIREATQADVVILYPYDPTQRRFILPPRFSGELLASFPKAMGPRHSDDIVARVLEFAKPLFAKESGTIYHSLHIEMVAIRNENFQEREGIHSTAILPLKVGDKNVGVLLVNFRQPQRFDATQKQLIDGLAHYAAIAIKNAQEYGFLLQRRVRELEILQHIDRELNSSLNLESVLHILLTLAQEHVPSEEASILLYNARANVLETKAAIGRHVEISRVQTISLSLQEYKGITRWVVEHKTAARIDNVHHDPAWRDLHIPVAQDTLSELDVPMLDGDEVIGVLNFENIREAAYSQADQHFLATLAGQAVLAIKNAQKYEREKRLVAEEQVLNDISREIISQLDLVAVFEVILEKALKLTKASVGNFMLYDAEHNDLWMAAERGAIKEKKRPRQSLEQGIVGYAARNRKVLNIDLAQQPWSDLNLDLFPGTRFELVVPMLAGTRLIGVLNVESVSQTAFSESDEYLLKGLTDLAVIAVQNAQAYEREKQLAAESQGLNEVSRQIISQLEPTNVFHLILEKALELTNSTIGSLHLFDAKSNRLNMVTEQGVAKEKKGLYQETYQGIVGYVARHQQSVNAGDVTKHPWNVIYMEFFPGVRSELAVAMMAGKELRGVLNVESLLPNNFSKEHERLLQSLADLAVVAVQNAELYKKAENEALRFELLYQAGQELGNIADWAQIAQAYDTIVQIAARQSKGQAVIYQYDETNAEMLLCYASHPQATFLPHLTLNGTNGQVVRERRTIIVEDSDKLPEEIAPIQSDPAMHSFVIIPIQFEEHYYGNLNLRHEEAGYFRDADIPFFEWLAQQLASTIYRLETTQARQEFEQRASSAEEMSSIGQSAFEVTHRLGNDLGLIHTYINAIRTELERQGVENREGCN